MTLISTATATKPLVTYPSTHGGKYHAASAVTDLAYCDQRTSLSLSSGGAIHVTPGQMHVHPLVCRRCLRAYGFTPGTKA